MDPEYLKILLAEYDRETDALTEADDGSGEP